MYLCSCRCERHGVECEEKERGDHITALLETGGEGESGRS